MYHMFSLKDFVKIHWTIILDIKDQWVIEKKILRYMMWGIMTIPSATKKIFRSVFGNVETTAQVEMTDEKLPCRKKAR